MKVVTFTDFGDEHLDAKHELCHYEVGCGEKSADILVLDISTIFDYEEKKHDAAKDKYASIAIIDDYDDYDAFKNFGIDAWINREDLQHLNQLLDIAQTKVLS
jgi:hypothetical protein